MDPNQLTPNIPVQPNQQPFTPLPPKPTPKFIFILGGLIILSIGLFGGYYLTKSSSKPTIKACTKEAKLCSDGSFVGRTGPNCEFALCPEITITQSSPTPDPIANWIKFSNPNVKFTLNYPPEFKIVYQSDGKETNLPNTLLTLENDKSFPDSHLTTQDIFLVQLIPNIKTAQACFILSDDTTPLKKSKTINGNTFYYSDKPNTVGLGTVYSNKEFKVFQDIGDRCYEIDHKYSKSSDWNIATAIELAKTDEEAASITFDQILSTFRFLGK